MIEQAINGDFMVNLLFSLVVMERRNMIHLTLPVIATHYLDSTNQWETVGMERRNEAINHIRNRSADSSETQYSLL